VGDIVRAYTTLHELGVAHSVETWAEGELIGGLYGVGIGRMFYGESMFSHRTDASKIALAHLCAFLADREVEMIDCQMHTSHLASLGAEPIPRADFLAALQGLTADPSLGCGVGRWPADGVRHRWT
jgi:leucyl/phenylalanyl-tRNA--protein transferase